jgi:quercetin dioxygenase-like cupin family protein
VANETLINWDDLEYEEARPGLERCAIGNGNVMLVYNKCHPGMETYPHSHDFEQVALILDGTGKFHLDDVAHEVSAGMALVVPAGVVHYVEPRTLLVNLDVFSPPREDYQHLLDWMRPDAG